MIKEQNYAAQCDEGTVKVGLSGHTMGSVPITEKVEDTKAKLMRARGCPIHKNTTTVMAKKSFTKMCLIYQKRAGLFSDEKVGDICIKYGHFTTTNKQICGRCKTGKAVRSGKPFKAPFKMTFKDLTIGYELKTQTEKKICMSGAKLSVEDVLKIRKLSGNGVPNPDIYKIYPKINPTTILRIIKRQTWRDV